MRTLRESHWPKRRASRGVDGDHGEWEVFNDEVLPLLADLRRTAIWLTRDCDETEDLLQETLVSAMRSFHNYNPGTNCRAWLITIMRRLNIRRLSRMRRVSWVDDPEGALADVAFTPPPSQAISDKKLTAGLNRLPKYFRDVVVLSDVGDFSYREILDALNVPIGTVMSRLSRGRSILRRELRPLPQSEPLSITRG